MDKLAQLILAGLVITAQAQDSRYITEPTDATSSVNVNVMFICDVDLGTPPDGLDWTEHITSHAGRTIFSSFGGTILEPDKYAVNGTYNLIVKNVQWQSGGSYGCKLASKTGDRKSADLVVLVEPSIAIPTLTQGQSGTITCTAPFGSPLPDNMNSAHVPTLSMFLGADVFGNSANDVLEDGYPGQRTHNLRRNVNYTANHADHDKSIRCVVSTQTPPFQVEHEQLLQIIFPVRDISISPRETSYYVGEHINCTAGGNPEPSFNWVPITVPPDSGTGIISGPTLVKEQPMIGENEWECRATNNVQGTNRIESRITFTVVPPTLSQEQSTPSPEQSDSTRHAQDSRYITLPSDATSGIGTDVMFTCDVDLGTNDVSDWSEHITNYAGTTIFTSAEGVVSDQNKYAVNGSYNLIVKNVQWQSGGSYSCKLASKTGPRQSAVVLLEPTISIPNMTHGQWGSISCTARFGGPLRENLKPTHIPKLDMFLGDNALGTSTNDVEQEGSRRPIMETIGRTVTYTADHVDHDKLVRCVVYTQTPSFKIQSEQVLQVIFPVRDISISPRETSYYVGEHINCTARGNSEPCFKWVPVTVSLQILNRYPLTAGRGSCPVLPWSWSSR